ncbi:hypothetical protein GCM10028790_20070 [Micromonospora taraxaci]|uniref:DDE superfamily endonuclease n=1 Tax=Micromonospora taraxaci TaxID=1316803 RepID=A0A561W581_9ACTN|nr:DDE superfamily endonuclease [Micromonospora taraxaci]
MLAQSTGQVGVFLVFRSGKGHALIDRQLYLPTSWTDDRDRCRAAGIPDEAEFATKVQMARTMLARALDSEVPVGWVTMDEAYGQSESLRVWLEHGDGNFAAPGSLVSSTGPAPVLIAPTPVAEMTRPSEWIEARGHGLLGPEPLLRGLLHCAVLCCHGVAASTG